MTILELIKKCATILNVKQILEDDALDNFTYEDNEKEVLSNNFELRRMFEITKVVLNEVNSYLPRVEEIEIEIVDKKLLKKSIAGFSKVINIKNQNGDYVRFVELVDHIKVDEDGVYKILFCAYPITNSVLNNVDTRHDVMGEDLFVSGVSSYYCLATGLFAEYNVYNAQYVDRLSRIKHLKLFSMPCRSWHG